MRLKDSVLDDHFCGLLENWVMLDDLVLEDCCIFCLLENLAR